MHMQEAHVRCADVSASPFTVTGSLCECVPGKGWVRSEQALRQTSKLHVDATRFVVMRENTHAPFLMSVIAVHFDRLV